MAEVAEDEGPVLPAGGARQRPARPRPAMAVHRQVEGPHVRLGVAWFVIVVAAALAASPTVAVVLALAAGLAAAQVVGLRAARLAGPVEAQGTAPRTGRRTSALPAAVAALLGDLPRLTAALGAAALPLAAVAGPDTVTAATVATATVALVVVVLTAPGADRRGARLAATATVVACALGFGGAAASVVLVRAEGVAAAVILILLVSAYEAGDFLVGTGSSTAWEGPAAGIAAVAVVALGASLLALVPLGRGGPLVLAGVVAVAAPAGPPLASALIGDGRTPARFARRLDAWLAVGPVAAWATAAMAG